MYNASTARDFKAPGPEVQVGFAAAILAASSGALLVLSPKAVVLALLLSAGIGLFALVLSKPRSLPLFLPVLIVTSGFLLDGTERFAPRLVGEVGIMLLIVLPVLAYAGMNNLTPSTLVLVSLICVPALLEAALILLGERQADDFVVAFRHAARAAVCFLAGITFSRNTEDQSRFILGFLLAAFCLAGLTILVAARVLPLPDVENVGTIYTLGPIEVPRSIGLEISQSFGGVVFALGAVIAVSRLLEHRRSGSTQSAMLAVLCCILAASAVTFSRNVLLTVTMACVLFLAIDALTAKKASVRPLLILAMAAMPLLVIPSGAFLTPGSIIAYNSHTVDLRYEQYNWALSMIESHFFVGIGSFEATQASEKAVGYMVHNEALRRLVETGIVGALSHYVAVLYVLAVGIKNALSGRSNPSVILSVGLIAMLFASQFYPGTKPEFLWLICGILLGLNWFAEENTTKANS